MTLQRSTYTKLGCTFVIVSTSVSVLHISSTIYKLLCKYTTVLTLHVNCLLISIFIFFLQICVQYCTDVVAVVEMNSIHFIVRMFV